MPKGIRFASLPLPIHNEFCEMWKKTAAMAVNWMMKKHPWPMHTRVWSNRSVRQLLLLYSSGHPCGVIAAKLGRSEAAVRHKLFNLGYSSARILEAESSLLSPLQAPDELREEWTPEEASLVQSCAREQLENREERIVRREIVAETQEEILATRFLEEFRRTVLALPPVINVPASQPAPQGGDVCVVLFGDLHCGQVVDPREIEGYPTRWGAYNPSIMVARIHEYEIQIARILRMHPAKKLVLVFLGDMVHGRLGHSLEDDLTLPIALQTELALHCLHQFVVRTAARVPHIEMHGVAGNHGRWPGQRKMPSDRRWSQLDTMLYDALGLLCEQTVGNFSYDSRLSARRVLDVANFRIQIAHGDQIRGGAFSSSGMAREVHNTLLRSIQTGHRPPDCYVIGDKHVTAALPMGHANFLVNGSFVGSDTFSLQFPPSPPSQTLFYISETLGRSETHLIPLQHARTDGAGLYDLKPSLAQLLQSFQRTTNPQP